MTLSWEMLYCSWRQLCHCICHLAFFYWLSQIVLIYSFLPRTVQPLVSSIQEACLSVAKFSHFVEFAPYCRSYSTCLSVFWRWNPTELRLDCFGKEYRCQERFSFWIFTLIWLLFFAVIFIRISLTICFLHFLDYPLQIQSLKFLDHSVFSFWSCQLS